MARAHERGIQSQEASLLPTVGAGALALVVLAGLVALLHPGLAHDLARMYASLRATGQVAAWGDSMLRASAAAAAASATIYVLVGFGRGVQSAPFLWLSPVLLGFGMAVMMRMQAAPATLPMAEPVFYASSALVLLGGGALLQRGGWAATVPGVMLMLVPLSTLMSAHVRSAGGATAAWQQLSSASALHAFVLVVLSVGLSFIAVATRTEVAPAPSRQTRRRFGHHAHADELEAALEQARVSELRVRASEERVSIAEQQLRLQSEELEHALAIQDDLKRLTPRRVGLRLLVAGLTLIAVFGAFAGTFLGVIRPLQLKVARADALAKHFEQERATLTSGFESERAALLKDLDQARASIQEAQANITKLQADVVTLTAAQADRKSVV
jgi:hypothetical protein